MVRGGFLPPHMGRLPLQQVACPVCLVAPGAFCVGKSGQRVGTHNARARALLHALDDRPSDVMVNSSKKMLIARYDGTHWRANLQPTPLPFDSVTWLGFHNTEGA